MKKDPAHIEAVNTLARLNAHKSPTYAGTREAFERNNEHLSDKERIKALEARSRDLAIFLESLAQRLDAMDHDDQTH